MIKLKVKSPSSCISDIELEVALDTSVIQIKDIITTRFPGNPPSSVKNFYRPLNPVYDTS